MSCKTRLPRSFYNHFTNCCLSISLSQVKLYLCLIRTLLLYIASIIMYNPCIRRVFPCTSYKLVYRNHMTISTNFSRSGNKCIDLYSFIISQQNNGPDCTVQVGLLKPRLAPGIKHLKDLVSILYALAKLPKFGSRMPPPPHTFKKKVVYSES